MPYIYENGQTRYVAQAEYVAWGKAQGLPTPKQNASGSYRPIVGGETVTVSSPATQNNMTKAEYRAARDSQIKQAKDEYASVDMKLAQASTGKTQLPQSEVSALEARRDQLANNMNDLYDGKLVTDGLLSRGRVAETGIVPNTATPGADTVMPASYEQSTANNPVTEDYQLTSPTNDLSFDITVTSTQVGSAEEVESDYLAAQANENSELSLQDQLDKQDINSGPDAVDGEQDPTVEQANLAAALRGEDEASLQDLLDANDVNDNSTAESPYSDGNGGIDQQQLAKDLPDEEAVAAESLKQQAQQQQAIRAQQQQQASSGDWRVKLRLAPGANYLYRASDPGILQPLSVTDGVVFPYMPRISTSYHAQYNTYELTHSNYRGAFYQGSHAGDVTIEAEFTAQDTYEANYLLAVIHFFRSVTKMFYGQDTQRGTPPPLVYLQGLGQFQFNLHPCVVKEFTYLLPNDVDYIRARVTDQLGFNMLNARDRRSAPANIFDSAAQRLKNAGLWPGGGPTGYTIMTTPEVATLGTSDPTYVPTKMTMNIVLMPMQSREQISKEFSLQKFADGTLVKRGFW